MQRSAIVRDATWLCPFVVPLETPPGDIAELNPPELVACACPFLAGSAKIYLLEIFSTPGFPTRGGVSCFRTSCTTRGRKGVRARTLSFFLGKLVLSSSAIFEVVLVLRVRHSPGIVATDKLTYKYPRLCIPRYFATRWIIKIRDFSVVCLHLVIRERVI